MIGFFSLDEVHFTFAIHFGICMKENILLSLQEAVEAISLLKEKSALDFIEKSAESLYRCFTQGGKVLLAGNGGSLCDAMHFAEELTGFYRHKRKALPAIALSDPGHMSCVANDLSYDQVFARGIEALGKKEDVFIAMTTSGNSPSIVEAVSTAKKLGLYTIAFLGKTGGKLKGLCDLELIVEGFAYSDRIQEAHMAAIHIIIEMLENRLFSSGTK
jgi:D-sedoheptulose 7-phosphate isomerase